MSKSRAVVIAWMAYCAPQLIAEDIAPQPTSLMDSGSNIDLFPLLDPTLRR